MEVIPASVAEELYEALMRETHGAFPHGAFPITDKAEAALEHYERTLGKQDG